MVFTIVENISLYIYILGINFANASQMKTTMDMQVIALQESAQVLMSEGVPPFQPPTTPQPLTSLISELQNLGTSLFNI